MWKQDKDCSLSTKAIDKKYVGHASIYDTFHIL